MTTLELETLKVGLFPLPPNYSDAFIESRVPANAPPEEQAATLWHTRDLSESVLHICSDIPLTALTQRELGF
jgi:hypothetical protein